MKKTRFWEESENVQSSKRLMQLTITAFALVLSTVYLVRTWDFAGTLAIFTGFMTVVTSILAIGKKQENDRAKIENNGENRK